MTQISYADCNEEHILECHGHSENGTFGSDILCSAISVLCLTAREYLENALSRGEIRDLYCDLGPGRALIKFSCENDSDAVKCIKTVLCGFKMLGESFPDNIDLDI